MQERHAILTRNGARQWRVPRIVTSDPAEAEAFVQDTLARGHEGVVVKALDSPYEAGRRGTGWIKVKPAHDAGPGDPGRGVGPRPTHRAGSPICTWARAIPSSGGFVMLGKTFKGLTDEMLRWQTQRFQELETTATAGPSTFALSWWSKSSSTASSASPATPAA